MVFRTEKWSSSGGSIDRVEGGEYSEFGRSDPNFGRRRLFLQSSSCRFLVKKPSPGGENGRKGQEVESDANWVPSYGGEAGNEAEEDEEEEKEAPDEVVSARWTFSNEKKKGKRKVNEISEAENVPVTSEEYEQADKVESDGDYEPSVAGAADVEETGDEGTSQSARERKRKRNVDDSGGELETFQRPGKKIRDMNGFHFEVNNVDRKKEFGTGGGEKSSGTKKRKFRKNRETDEVDMESEDAHWVKSLRGPHLRLMLALKELGTVRVNTIKEDSLYNCLTPAALRAIGIIMEEHVKEQLCSLANESPGDGGVQFQNGDSLSPKEAQSADCGHRVDDREMDDVEIDQTSTKKSKSSRRSSQAEGLVNEENQVNSMKDLQTEEQGDRTIARKSKSSRSSQAEGLVNDEREVNSLKDIQTEEQGHQTTTRKSKSSRSSQAKGLVTEEREVNSIKDRQTEEQSAQKATRKSKSSRRSSQAEGLVNEEREMNSTKDIQMEEQGAAVKTNSNRRKSSTKRLQIVQPVKDSGQRGG
ncbi:hypothetical protein Mapa_003328 [Marchantia paleacea]|nr:hypothetical protein Mapa_003328 [Marchantia paleacea]